ncbi:MAG TPA: hypothetical protein PK113_05550, partial [Bacillota bacterium]|nr:hypothetical protein [Bacillota bacterium]
MKKKVLLSLLVFLVFLFQACSTNDLNALLSIQFSKQKTIPFFGLMMGTISVESYFANEIASLSVNGMFYPVSDRKGHFVIFDDVILEQKTSNSGLTFYNTFGDSIHMANYSFAFFSDEGIHRHYFEPAEGLYFIEEGYAYPWQLYQMDYIAGLNFDQRVTLYLNSVGSKKTVFVVLLQSGVLRFCEYSDYPFQGDEPTIEQGQQSGEFPQICLDVSRGRIPIDPAN